MPELDCFAELVIGPTTSGWARWLAMARVVRELTICDAADDAKLEALEALVADELPASENSATFKCASAETGDIGVCSSAALVQ